MKMASENESSKTLSKYISRSLILSGKEKQPTELAKNKTFVLELLHNISNNENEMFEVGSVAEGTETPDSDIDRMFVVPHMVVALSEIYAYPETKLDVCLLDESESNPGYARLQLIRMNSKTNPITNYLHCIFPFIINIEDEDIEKKGFLSSEQIINYFVYELNSHCKNIEYVRNGPCATTEHVNTYSITEENGCPKKLDHAYAIPFCEWPVEAKGWFTRWRAHNWPPQSLVERIRGKKCYVVPSGETKSVNDQYRWKDLQWRVSYLLSERELVWSFNDTQLHCYYLLKRLLTLFLETIAPNQLCSYHMKILLFWLSEEKGLSMWYDENLIHCVEVSLDKLINCVEKKTLLNYFNCHANLFMHKFQNDSQRNQVLEKICEIKENIIPYLFDCLPEKWKWPGVWEIKSSETDNVENIRRCADYKALETEFQATRQTNETLNSYKIMFDMFIQIISKYKDATTLLTQRFALKEHQLQGADSEFVKMTTISLELRFAMAYFRQITTQENKEFQTCIDSKKSITLEGVINMVSNTCMIDKMSGELFHATINHFFGRYIKSTRIVKALLKRSIHLYYPGYCSTYKTIHLTGEVLCKQEDGIPLKGTEEKTFPAYDIIFSHEDMYCVPNPLKFECALSGFPKNRNIVVIHPCVYAYFLLCYGKYKSNDFASFRIALKYLEKAVQETKGGRIRHHALNILSYCYVLDRNLQKAFEYFAESCLETEKLGIVWNAAAFHIAIILMKRLERLEEQRLKRLAFSCKS